MVTILAIVTSLIALQAHSQDSLRIERLAALGRLWYATRLFHPYLAYRDVDWDAALVAAIPRASAARSADEYAAAVQSMLDALGDPVTRVQRKETGGSVSMGEPDPRSRWTADSILIVTASNYADLEQWNRSIVRFDSLAQLVPRARAVVLDLRRRTTSSSGGYVGFVLGESRFLPQLIAEAIAAPGLRWRLHSGYRGDATAGSGGYFSAWVTQDGEVFSAGSSTTSRPAAFIANDRSEVPSAALALQAAGQAVMVIEGAATDASLVNTTPITLSDGLTVQLRLTELVYPDGSGGLPADTVLPATAAGTPDAALEAALEMVRFPKPRARPRALLPARAAPAAQRAYAEQRYPSAPLRLLAAVRIWGTMEYFHAYRALYDEDWYAVLKASIPKFEAARDSLEYALAVAEMVSHTDDTHNSVRSPVLDAHWGVATAPLRVRMIEGVPVVTGFTNDSVARAAGVRVGDVIVRVDGAPSASRLARRERYLAASTPQSLHWRAVRELLAGPEGSIAALQLRGAAGRLREVRLPRQREFRPSCSGCRTGEVLRILPGNIGYADLDRLSPALVDSMFALFRGTRAIIFDMRGYPQGTAWPIAPRLTDRETPPAAWFRRPMATFPHPASAEESANEEMTWSFVQHLPPTTHQRYHGRTVMLIDERTISQAEHTGLFFEAANGTRFIGSPTTGANGDVTIFVVPGGISVGFSGHDVRHIDGRQLQRMGLQPHLRVRPTIAGIRAGRDEVLEAAVAYVRRSRR